VIADVQLSKALPLNEQPYQSLVIIGIRFGPWPPKRKKTELTLQSTWSWEQAEISTPSISDRVALHSYSWKHGEI